MDYFYRQASVFPRVPLGIVVKSGAPGKKYNRLLFRGQIETIVVSVILMFGENIVIATFSFMDFFKI